MAVRVARSLSDLDDVTEAWAALADASGARHYAQPFWALSWWRHLAQGELHVAMVESGGRLVALAPLYRRRQFGVDVLKFLGSDILGVSEFLVEPGQDEAGDELWSYLMGRSRSVLDLRHHRFAGGGISALRRIENKPWHAQLGPSSPSVSITGSWDDYWIGRGKKFRRELERRLRRAEDEQLPARVEVAVKPHDVDQSLQDVTRIFDAAEQANPKAHFLAGAYRPFTVEMLQRAAEQSRLAVFVLYFGDRPAATGFGFHSGTTLSTGGARFDPAFGRFAPGHLIKRAQIAHAFAVGCSEVDMGPGNAAYKGEWSTGAYDTLDITTFSSRSAHIFHAGKAAASSSSVLQKLIR